MRGEPPTAARCGPLGKSVLAAAAVLLAGLVGVATFDSDNGVAETDGDPTGEGDRTGGESTPDPADKGHGEEGGPAEDRLGEGGDAATVDQARTEVSELVWGMDNTAADPDRVRPELGRSYLDPAYHTAVRRVSDAGGTRFDRNTYSRRNPENADGAYFFTYHGSGAYHVYDRETLELVRALDIHPDAEPQWHPTEPGTIRHISGPNSSVGDLKLYELDVETGTSLVVADLTSSIRKQLPDALYMYDRAEGAPSADGNRYAWLVHDADEAVIGIVSYDLATDTILAVSDQLRADEESLDWVSMSPSGRYVLAGYSDGTFSYDADLSNERRLTPTGEHSDIAINASGNDAYVHIDFSAGPNGGWLVSHDLVTGTDTRIFDLYQDANTSIHVSGKGYAKPGWVLVSSYSCKVGDAWSCHKVMAVELAPDGRILNLAHTYNCGDTYWTETHAAVNHDFTRAYFNSDSGSCGIDAEVFEITIPAFE